MRKILAVSAVTLALVAGTVTPASAHEGGDRDRDDKRVVKVHRHHHKHHKHHHKGNVIVIRPHCNPLFPQRPCAL